MTHTLLFTAGAFGQSVGARVQALAPMRAMPLPHEPATLRACMGDARAVAVAAWRPFVPTFELIDTLCFELGVPWTLAELHGERLSCGPIVQPGHGPCYHCYRKRWASQHPAPEREMLLERAYARDLELGPPGFIAPLVEMAACALIEDLEAPVSAAGRMRVVDTLSAAVTEIAVIGMPGCPRCGRPRQDAVKPRFVHHPVSRSTDVRRAGRA